MYYVVKSMYRDNITELLRHYPDTKSRQFQQEVRHSLLITS